jgi:hypothetical protein
MKILNYIIIEVAACILCLCSSGIYHSAAADELQVYVFNVGTGNCTCVKFGDKLLFVDAGAESAGRNPRVKYTQLFEAIRAEASTTEKTEEDVDEIDGDIAECLDPELFDPITIDQLSPPQQSKFDQIFEGTSETRVLLTHYHVDHYNLMFALNPQRVIAPKHTLPYTIVNLHEFLSPEVDIIPIRPPEWPTKYGIHPHHANTMLKIRYAHRTILFMGDVSMQLLKLMLNDQYYSRELRDVDVMIATHHGTNQGGELMAIEALSPACVIASANPFSTTGYKLPWDDILSPTLPSFSHVTDVVVPHEVSTRSGTEHDITAPIYITRDVELYYKLTIDSEGTITLKGDELPRNLFESKMSLKRLEQKFKHECRQVAAFPFIAVQLPQIQPGGLIRDRIGRLIVTHDQLSAMCAAQPVKVATLSSYLAGALFSATYLGVDNFINTIGNLMQPIHEGIEVARQMYGGNAAAAVPQYINELACHMLDPFLNGSVPADNDLKQYAIDFSTQIVDENNEIIAKIP